MAPRVGTERVLGERERRPWLKQDRQHVVGVVDDGHRVGQPAHSVQHLATLDHPTGGEPRAGPGGALGGHRCPTGSARRRPTAVGSGLIACLPVRCSTLTAQDAARTLLSPRFLGRRVPDRVFDDVELRTERLVLRRGRCAGRGRAVQDMSIAPPVTGRVSRLRQGGSPTRRPGGTGRRCRPGWSPDVRAGDGPEDQRPQQLLGKVDLE